MNERNVENWCFWEEMEAEEAGPGVVLRVLAFCDEMMCVENTFKAGAIGALHHHPHTQITYIAKGRFLFTIGNETHEIAALRIFVLLFPPDGQRKPLYRLSNRHEEKPTYFLLFRFRHQKSKPVSYTHLGEKFEGSFIVQRNLIFVYF